MLVAAVCCLFVVNCRAGNHPASATTECSATLA
jgi:hypothetical protein